MNKDDESENPPSEPSVKGKQVKRKGKVTTRVDDFVHKSLHFSSQRKNRNPSSKKSEENVWEEDSYEKTCERSFKASY